MKPPAEAYDRIRTLPGTPQHTTVLHVCQSLPPALADPGFIHIPGAYCAGCGETFALYSFSGHAPTGVDENGKPFYERCFLCPKGDA